jgi:hypothetical protein
MPTWKDQERIVASTLVLTHKRLDLPSAENPHGQIGECAGLQ